MEPVDCDKLLTIFSTPGKLAWAEGVKLAGLTLRASSLLPYPSLLPASFYTAHMDALSSSGLCGRVGEAVD